ncbi:Transcription factor Adf-1 [Pseudolycoriella hygida]|uniref:Transcription factor Adf-1 n=1 Tax=Pseudolycoriella hygida TaxID=35572 RepID=A0A9Q0NGM1_9DIPT|nr:Transcription factor Adf-1 [Pseudolycoriella hygida]
MMDERLIGEVQKHAIIYNRQKSNMINGDKSASKEMAWAKIAMSLGTDADSCKKRWKYLRERYVQQKKVGDSPSYEHLSRPYLEKMKFLDHFIQPRKSYRNVVHLLASPSNSQNSMNETSDMDRSIQMSLQNFHNDASVDHLHHIQNSSTDEAYRQFYQRLHVREPEKLDDLRHNMQTTAPDLIKTELLHNNMPSSSSSIVSQPSPLPVSGHGEMLDDNDQKRRRTSIIDQAQHHHQQSDNDEQSSADVGDSELELQRSPPFPNEFLYPFYQHAQRQIRNSEQLLGELVTSELLKMTKERKRIAQKKILEILFFDD